MMTTVDRSSRVIDTLTRTDPEFADLVYLLYGEEPEEVFKANPDQSDTATSDSGLKRRLAFAGVLAGGALGVKELGNELPHVGGAVGRGAGRVMGQANKAGKLIPVSARNVLASPKGRVGVAGTALGADALAGNELDPRKQKQPVGKLSAPSMGDMVNGIRTKLTGITGRLIPAAEAGKPTGPASQVPLPKDGNNTKAMNNAKQFTQGVLQAGGTPAGKTIAAGGLVATALKGKKIKDNVQANNQLQQSDPLSKGRDIEWAGTFSKLDDEKHLAFGWASVIKVNGLPVVDYQADQIDEADLEDAAYRYVLNSRVGGHMHKRSTGKFAFSVDVPHHVSDLVESMVFTDEKVAKMGLPDDFPRGWWAGYKIHDPDVWEDVKSGRLAGFSIHGKGKREEIPMDTAMGW